MSATTDRAPLRALSGIKNAPLFLYRKWDDFLLFHTGWLRNLGWVLGEVPTTDRFVQGDSDGAVSEVYSPSAEALALPSL